MAATPFTRGQEEGSEVLAPPGPTLVKKKPKWNQGSDIGRWKLALGCVVPTTYQQRPGGKHCSGGKNHEKGDPAQHGGQTFKVGADKVKLVLLALASWDNGRLQVFPGNDWLVEFTGVKIRSVIYALNALAQAGFLTKTSRGFRKSKKYWLNWDLIRARQIKWASKQSGQAVEQEEGTEELQEQEPWAPATEPVKAHPKVASGYHEADPVADPLVAILIERLGHYGKSNAIHQGTLAPVVKQLLKLHAADTVEEAIQTLDRYQYKCIAAANSPAAYLRGTLDTQLSMPEELRKRLVSQAMAEREKPVKPAKVDQAQEQRAEKKLATRELAHQEEEDFEEEEPNLDDYEEAEEEDDSADDEDDSADDEDDKRYRARVKKANQEAEDEARRYRF